MDTNIMQGYTRKKWSFQIGDYDDSEEKEENNR